MSPEYPDEPAGEFPRPPREFVDGEDREISVRRSTAEDFEPLVEMYLDFHPEDRAQGIPPGTEREIRDWLEAISESDSPAVVATHDVPVGHAVLVPDQTGAYELAIFVLREYQAAGIGTELLRSLLGLAQAEGIDKVWLTVERWNDPAIRLYEKVGFERTGEEGLELEMAIRLA